MAPAGELLACFQWLTPEESMRVMDDPVHARGPPPPLATQLREWSPLADERTVVNVISTPFRGQAVTNMS